MARVLVYTSPARGHLYPIKALERGLAAFGERAPLDRADLRKAIDRVEPDVLVVDANSWGALAAADASGLPWSAFMPYFTPLPAVRPR